MLHSIEALELLSSYLFCENPESIVILRNATNTPKRNPFGQIKFQIIKCSKICRHPLTSITTIYQKPHPFKIQIHETNLINPIFINNHHFQSLDP